MSLLFNTYGIVQLHLNRRRCSGSLVDGMPAWHVQDQKSFRARTVLNSNQDFNVFNCPFTARPFEVTNCCTVRATQRDVMQIWIWHVRVLRCPSVEALHHPMRTPAYVERLTKLRTVPDTHLYLTVFVKQGEKNWNITSSNFQKKKSTVSSTLLS